MQPLGDRLLDRLRRGAARPGGAGRPDPVGAGHDTEPRRVDAWGSDRLAGDAPLPGPWRVVAVPRAAAFAGDAARQRYAVVEPVLERDEIARRVTVGVEPGEANEFALGEERVERQEEALDDPQRQRLLAGRSLDHCPE